MSLRPLRTWTLKKAPLSPNPVGYGPIPGPAILSLASILQKISLSIQNCNSLNLSTTCPKQTLKIKSIIDLCSDIIFLSDLRLNNSESVNDVEKIFLSSPQQYKFIHNSSRSSRGVGLLISSKLDYDILDTFRDESENILGIHINVNSHRLLFVSIYGPNFNDNIFFQDLSRRLALFPDSSVIIGGDWNCTYSTADTLENIDIFRMASPPSLFRSRALLDICEMRSLSDPFRDLHPDRLDFTYRPNSRRPNRSRLDFFIISDNLLNHISSCDISTETCKFPFWPSFCQLKVQHKKI